MPGHASNITLYKSELTSVTGDHMPDFMGTLDIDFLINPAIL